MTGRWILGILSSLWLGSSPVMAKVKVVASFSILADFVRVIGDTQVEVTTIVPLASDPHVYQPTPDVAQRLTQADLIIVNGLGLEGWMTRLSEAADNAKKVVIASKNVKPRLLFEPLLSAASPVADPHAWHDVQAAKQYVKTITQALVATDPAHETLYQNNEKEFQQQLTALDAWIVTQFDLIPAGDRKIVSAHDAFGYYGARYGLIIYALQGISTENEPSAKQLAYLIQLMRREKISSLFVENMSNQHLLQQVALETGVRIGGTLYADSLSLPDAPAASYVQMMRYNTQTIIQSLKNSSS